MNYIIFYCVVYFFWLAALTVKLCFLLSWLDGRVLTDKAHKKLAALESKIQAFDERISNPEEELVARLKKTFDSEHRAIANEKSNLMRYDSELHSEVRKKLTELEDTLALLVSMKKNFHGRCFNPSHDNAKEGE